jgi:DNA-binding CsgD family transcriptional regulator/N-acetylneuraminic acid mutarotase
MNDSIELSEREQEILKLVATGASNKEIAYRLTISTNTVKVHLRNIFGKIGAASRTEAAMYAVQTGLVSGSGRSGESDNNPPGASAETTQGIFASAQIIDGSQKEKNRRLRLTIFAGGIVLLMVLGAIAIYASQRFRGEVTSNAAAGSIPARWQVKANMPTPRYGLAVAAYENLIYAIGGATRRGPSGVLERYNPGTDAWVELATKPTAVSDVQAAVIGGRIYIPGGSTSNKAVTDILEIYDIQENIWVKGARLPEALSAYALVSYEGKLYLFGGWDGDKFVDTVYEYEPGLDSWNEKTAMPYARGYAGATVAGGNIYVIGGFDGENILSGNDIYSPVRDDGLANPWSKMAPLPEGRYAVGVTSVADFIYVFGGINEKGEQNVFFEFLPTENKWNIHSDAAAQPSSKLGLIAVQAHLYTLGGEFSGKPIDQNYAYQAIYTVAAPIIR